ncbi:DUF4352 domain-containing protein [Haloarcula sp. GH36]|uniref:DUF4352 domain-containing protein n=1 Tax=Haloarcula montana TaxID=3111776 RepID=UPI002D7735EF|nr:DUF4352 domain-containing protein [Haloarcula sp. GH36]
MHRRTVLATAGTILFAGCSSLSEPDEADPSSTPTETTTPTETPTATRTATKTPTDTPTEVTDTPTPEPPNYQVSNQTPLSDSYQLDKPWPLEFTVTNIGDEAGEFSTTLQRQSETGAWRDVQRFEEVIDSGENRSFSASIDAPPEPGEFQYRLSGTGVSWTLEFVKPADFASVITTAPDQIEIGETLGVTVSVTNTGGKAGSATVSVGAQPQNETMTRSTDEFSISLQPGESITKDITLGSFPYLGTLELMLNDERIGTTVDVVGKQLSLGGSYVTPKEVKLEAEAIELIDSYTYDSGDNTYTHSASDGSQFALVTFRSKNHGSQPIDVPELFEIYLLDSRNQYESGSYRQETDEYDGGTLFSGAVKRGIILYEIPDSVTKSDLRVAWTGNYAEGDVAIRWS